MVVKGSIFSVPATRPDTHVAPGFNLDLVRDIRSACNEAVPVVAQGSIVDVGQAEWALGDDRCDLVEMTRAQIADADLVSKAATDSTRIRPCILCNQMCQVRDNRNPIVTCVVDPRSGHELDDPDPCPRTTPKSAASDPLLLVVGGGPAGLETARVAAERGHRVRLVEAGDCLGGMVPIAAAGSGRESLAAIAEWLEAEVRRLGVEVVTGHRITAVEIAAHSGPVIMATGSVDGRPDWSTGDKTPLSAPVVLSAALADNLSDVIRHDEPVIVVDGIGGPIGLSVAELLAQRGHQIKLITSDPFAGQMLALSGDLAPCNTRLAQLGVEIVGRVKVVSASSESVTVEHQYSGERRVINGTVIDAGPRLPDIALWEESGGQHSRVGDCVAPRTIHEAILEARRAVMAL